VARSTGKSAKSSASSSRRDRVRALPWAAVVQGGVVVGRRVADMSAKDRARLGRLLRESRGWPGRLAPKERAELRKLLGKLDPKALSRELLPLVRGGGRRKRR
jgi:hypothetical protein